MKCAECKQEFDVPKPSRKVRKYCCQKCARKAISAKGFFMFHRLIKAKAKPE